MITRLCFSAQDSITRTGARTPGAEDDPDLQPYAIAMKNGSPFGIAGLWRELEGPGVRRVDQNICGYHNRCERVSGPNP